MSSNRLQSLTFDTCIYMKSNFPVSLIVDCLFDTVGTRNEFF